MKRYKPTDSEKQEYLAYHTQDDVINNLYRGIKELEEYDWQQVKAKTTLVCGGMAAFDKGILNFLNKLHEYENIFLLSEITAEFRRYTRDKACMPYICTPHLLAKEMILYGMKLDCNPVAKKMYEEKVYIREAVENLQLRHPNLGENYAIIWCFYAKQYIECLLEKLEPKRVVLWNEFYAFHHIFRGVAKDKNISVSYLEFGCIPGTFAFDMCGQQGESCIARNELKVSSLLSLKELTKTEKVIKWIKKSGLNRNEQPRKMFKLSMVENYDVKKPVVVYLGQNDFESGLQPYTDNSKKYHSPYFKTSDEAAKVIEKICINNGWNFVYKLHPIMAALGASYQLDPQTRGVVIDQVNINSVIKKANVVITILSQGAYISLIQEKPIVMLGYTQLRNKGCTYQIWNYIEESQCDIEEGVKICIEEAINKGYTEMQRKKFLEHTTYMLKNYLYDDLVVRNIRYGKKIEEFDFKGKNDY